MVKAKKKVVEAEVVEPVVVKQKEDLWGIFSLVASLCWLPLVGFILGLIGASKAKKEGRSVALSRAGWISGLVFMILTVLVLIVVGLIIWAVDFNNTSTDDQPKLEQIETLQT